MSSNKPEPEYLNRLNCVAKVKHTRKTATTAISASKSKGLSMYKCENCEFYHLTSRATEVGAKPTAGRKQDLSGASTPSQEDNNFEQELDDLIMRLKDCISHEHTNQFGDRCITKVQFKQEMKALYQSSLEEAVLQIFKDMEACKNHPMITPARRERYNAGIDFAIAHAKEQRATLKQEDIDNA